MRPNILMPIMIFMTKYYNSSKHICRTGSVSHQIFNIFLPILFALGIFAGLVREESDKNPGMNSCLVSDFVTVKSIDSLRVWSYTDFNDSTRTDKPNISFLGQIYDPYFGTTTAEFVTQIRLEDSLGR